MEITIQDAVSACITELRKHYGSEACIKNDMEHIYTPLVHFCKRKGIIYYNKEITEQFIIESQKRWKSVKYANRVKFGIQRLVDFMETGKINYNRKVHNKYIPIDSEHLYWANEIINSNCGYKSKSVSAIIRSFFCYIESKSIKINDVTDKVYLDFFEYRKSINPETPRYTKQALVLISEYLISHDIVRTKLDFNKLKIRKPHLAVIKPYSKNEIIKINKILENETKVRDKAIFTLAITTGLRFCDISNLKLSNIDWENKVININQQKTGSPLSLPIGEVTQNYIAQYLLTERPNCKSSEVFISCKAPFKKLKYPPVMFEKVCTLAGIEKIKHRSFHSLRRTFASSLSEEHVPLSIISQLLGHKNSDYDRPYLSYDTEKMMCCTLDLNNLPSLKKEFFMTEEN